MFLKVKLNNKLKKEHLRFLPHQYILENKPKSVPVKVILEICILEIPGIPYF
jgi:hypothetical protein